MIGQKFTAAMQRAALLSFVALLAGAGAAWADAEGRFERTLQVSGPVTLDVKTGSGSIQVRKGGSTSVNVVAKIKARDGWSGMSAEEKVKRLEVNPPITQSGNTIRIGEIDDRDLRDNVSISYEISTPAETTLHSNTGSGSQSIAGLNGTVEVGTGSGSVSVADIGNEARVSTGSGSIELRTVKGGVHARTGSGGITAVGIAGAFSGSTGSGTVRLEQTSAGDVDVETGSGGIEVSGLKGSLRARTGSGSIHAEGRQTGDWSLHSSSGGITVRLPEDAAFELSARSASGTIQTSHPITVVGTIGKHELNGKVGGGGPRLELSTSSGSIRIE